LPICNHLKAKDYIFCLKKALALSIQIYTLLLFRSPAINYPMTEYAFNQLLPEFLINSNTYSVVITDFEGAYIFVNDLFKQRFSYISEDLIGQNSLAVVYNGDHEKCIEAVKDVLQNPCKIVRVSLRKPSANGKDFFWTDWEFSQLKDEKNIPVGILCVGHDSTENAELNFKVKEFADKVDTIIEEMRDGFYELNHKWEFIKINSTAEQILGTSREILIGKKIWDFFPDDSDYNYPNAFRKAMHEFTTVNFEDFRKDIGRWYNSICYPSYNGIKVFFKDVTEEKRNQLKLKETSQNLQAILESTFNCYILISPEYKILQFNSVADNLFQELTKKPLITNEDIRGYLVSELSGFATKN
jgi:PAS domain S-box-containing protein